MERMQNATGLSIRTAAPDCRRSESLAFIVADLRKDSLPDVATEEGQAAYAKAHQQARRAPRLGAARGHARPRDHAPPPARLHAAAGRPGSSCTSRRPAPLPVPSSSRSRRNCVDAAGRADWAWWPVELQDSDRVAAMLREGRNPNQIARALGISKSKAYRPREQVVAAPLA
jgi:hypothetical protein